MQQVDIIERVRLPDVRQQTIQGVRRALHQEKSSILSYFRNFNVPNQEKNYYQLLVEIITKMLLSINKIVYLKNQQDILSSMTELHRVVGSARMGRRTQNNLSQLQNELANYHRLHTEFVRLQNTV